MSLVEATSAQLSGPEKKRRRPALACEQCRSRKVRCDRNLPCTTCKKSRNQLCTYTPQPTPKRASNRTASSAVTSPSDSISGAALPRHEPPLLPLRGEITRSNSHSAHSQDTENILWQSSFASNSAVQGHRHAGDVALTPESLPSGNATIASLVDRVKQLEGQLNNALQRRGDPGECAALCRDEPRPAEHLDRGFVSKARYFGRSHWMNAARLVFMMCGYVARLERDKTSDLHRDMERCKTMARTIKARRVPVFHTISIGKSVPPREVADQLIEAYLRTFETVYRVVHVPTFRAEYEKYWTNPQGVADHFLVLMQLCMAIGAAVRDETFSLRASATQWVYEAQFWLMMPCEKSRMTIPGLQISILLHQAKHMTNIGADLTWVGAGSLLRMAMCMGLHEDPKCIAKMTAFLAEMRRRLWATVLEIQLQSSLDSGGPPLIAPEDFDTDPPANLDDSQLLENAESAYPIAKDPSEATQMSVPLALFGTWRARLAVVKTVNEVRSTATYNETLRVNSDLTTALQAMMRHLKTLRVAGSISPFQLRYAEFATYRFFIGLHQPVLSRALRNPVYYFSRKICVDMAFRLAATTFLLASEPPRDPSEMDLYRLFLCASGQYRTALTQAAMLAGLELVHHAEEEPKAHCGPLSSGSAELRALVESWAELCRKRIVAGETNIKGYIGASSLLAHIDGVEAGCSRPELEERVRVASRECLDTCLEILTAMAARDAAPEAPAETGAHETGIHDFGVPELDIDDMEGFDDMMGDWSWGGGMTPGRFSEPSWGFQNPFPEPPPLG